MRYMFRLCWVKHSTCLLVLLCTHSKYQGANITHGTCICYDHKGVYNLTSLQNTDGEPRFQVSGPFSNVYYYNPCSSFEKRDAGDNGCTIDAAVCLGGTGGPYYKIGDQSSAKCEHGIETEGPELVYKTAEYPGDQDHPRVRLMCNWSKEEPDFKKIKADKGRHWVFSLTHRCACPNGCPEDPSPTTSITASSRTTEKTTRPLTVTTTANSRTTEKTTRPLTVTTTAPSRTTEKTTRPLTVTTTAPSRTTGKTGRATTGFPVGTTRPSLAPPPDELWSPLTVSFVVVVAVLCVILAVLSIRFCLRPWRHNEDNGIRQPLLAGEENVVEVTENTFPKSNDGGRIENVLNVSQPLPVGSSNSSCNITVSKKHDFNKVKNASVPL